MSYPIPGNEAQRLRDLDDLRIVDTPHKPDFDALVHLARELFDVPISLISLIDNNRQWFKAVAGVVAAETRREVAFCSYTICSSEPFIVPDASRDERFRENSLVTGDPKIRFYAGISLSLTPGVNLGSLCIIDRRPRTLDDAGLRKLKWLGEIAVSLLHQHKTTVQMTDVLANVAKQAAHIRGQSLALTKQKRILDSASQLVKMGAWEKNLVTAELEWSDGMFALHEMERTPELKLEHHLQNYPPSDRRRLIGMIERSTRDMKPFTFEGRMHTAKGNLRWVRLVSDVEIQDGKEIRRFGLKQDITEERAMARRVLRLAQCDDLTGLYNRPMLREKLTEISNKRNLSPSPVYLFSFDLDGFKDVNDTHGHAGGDACLRRIARRVRAGVGKGCLVARVGGDEFVVLRYGSTIPLHVDKFAERIQRAVEMPVDWNGHSFQLTASIGISMRGEGDIVDPDELIREADLALYEAKSAGRHCHRIFRPALQTAKLKKIETLNDIRGALTQNQLELYFQPKVRLGDGHHMGFEALLRWNRPDGSILTPGSFMAALEDPELSKEIGAFVIKAALSQAERWMQSGVPFENIAINLSASQFRDPALAESLLSAIMSRGLHPCMIEAEVTEGVFMSTATNSVLSACRALKAGGMRIAFDDFGTGFASLTHLRDFPVDIIKIDRSFVSKLQQGENATTIVNAIVGMARSLSMSVVAEGVETAAQAAFLEAIGCNMAQGYLFGQPVSSLEAVRRLESHQPGRVIL